MAAKSDRLEQDLKSPEFLHGVAQGFWELSERDGNTVYVLLHAPMDAVSWRGWSAVITGGRTDSVRFRRRCRANSQA